MKARKRRTKFHLDVTGWRYTRRWTVGYRPRERWIGARYNFACDWWEIGLLGLTICVPVERNGRTPPAS